MGFVQRVEKGVILAREQVVAEIVGGVSQTDMQTALNSRSIASSSTTWRREAKCRRDSERAKSAMRVSAN